MGYGNLPNFTEYNSAGGVLLDGELGPNVQDFRTYLSPWSGQPTTSPAIVDQTQRLERHGADELERRDRRGLVADPRGLLPNLVGSRLRPCRGAAFRQLRRCHAAALRTSRVSALDSNGNVLGTSAPSHVG